MKCASTCGCVFVYVHVQACFLGQVGCVQNLVALTRSLPIMIVSKNQ